MIMQFDEYKSLVEHIKQLIMLKARATDNEQKAYYTERIRSLNDHIARGMQG